jgi:hypothetical protein
MGSEPVAAVRPNTVALITHNRPSRRSVSFTSFTAAMVMIAITAGAIP